MPRAPVCVKCQCFYRPKKNGYTLMEGMPNGTSDPAENIRGRRKPSAWQPYKLWRADLWQCPDCGHEIVVGFGAHPMAEHYQPGFKEFVERYPPQMTINDC